MVLLSRIFLSSVVSQQCSPLRRDFIYTETLYDYRIMPITASHVTWSVRYETKYCCKLTNKKCKQVKKAVEQDRLSCSLTTVRWPKQSPHHGNIRWNIRLRLRRVFSKFCLNAIKNIKIQSCSYLIQHWYTWKGDLSVIKSYDHCFGHVSK